MNNLKLWRLPLLFLGLCGFLTLLLGTGLPLNAVGTGSGVPGTVHLPYTTAVEPDIPAAERAVFWFGEVGPTTETYSDVRLIYNEEKLHVTLHNIDQYMFYDPTPTTAELTQYDAATLYLNLTGTTGTAPTTNAYQFVAGLSNLNVDRQLQRSDYEQAFRGNGSNWVETALYFESDTGTQTTNGLNNVTDSDAGWNVTFRIPYTTLGLAGKPAENTNWGFAVILHDRDDAAGSTLVQNPWPETMNPNSPLSWGELIFGLPDYTPPPVLTDLTSTTIRHETNGADVPDGHVGGATNCAGGIPPFWPTWGNLNHSGDFQVNIQNQWNLGDFACFSKYYVTFPLDALPLNQGIESASLRMYHFGNSLPELAEPSMIQVLTVDEDWNENTLVWNNAPLAVENVARSWVNPIPAGGAGQFITWDLSQAVADAYAAGQPLRLVLYSADNARHSGKYFNSSEVLNPDRRPTLFIDHGSLYGFAVMPQTVVQTAVPGGNATIEIDLQAAGGFSEFVTGDVGSTSGDINAVFAAESVVPPGTFTLNISHLDGGQTSGGLYPIPLTFTGDGIVRTTTVYLLVNGAQTYAPLLGK